LDIETYGFWFLVFGSWFFVPGSWFSVHGSWFSVHGAWFSFFGSRFLVLGSWFLVLSSRFFMTLPVGGGQTAAHKFTITRNHLKLDLALNCTQVELGEHSTATQMALDCQNLIKKPSRIFFCILSADRWLGKWILRFRKKPRGALERAFAIFFAQTAKMTNSLLPKKNAQITLDDQKVMFFQVYYQNHLNMASTGPQMDLKWDSK
jgi:hypothetical protein